MSEPIRLGTRASQLARTQSATVGDALAAASGRPWAEVLVRTPGDDTTRPLDQPGSPGLFVSTLRRALLAGEVDVIVHSFKDLPSLAEPGIALGAVAGRVDPRDALVARDGLSLAALPPGAVVGTSSPRRSAAIRRARPDLVVQPIRGNVDTRIRRVREGEVDATVLAVAGLLRIGRLDEVAEYLDDLLPAPAQGALAVECRADDADMLALLSTLDDPVARLETAAERQVLVGIDAACTTAVAARAHLLDGRLRLRAELTEGDRHATADVSCAAGLSDVEAARGLGMRAAAALVGGDRPVLLIRSEGNETDADQLAAHGVACISEPYVRISPTVATADARAMTALLEECADDPALAARTWLVATSPMTVPSWLVADADGDVAGAVRRAVAAGMRTAATGLRTATTLRELGADDVLVPGDEASARGLLAALREHGPARAVFPHGNLALRTLPEGLREAGWQVDEAVVYETATVEQRPGSAALVESGEVAAVVLRSPSAVRALAAHCAVPPSVAVVCAGRTTEEAARAAGLHVTAVAASPASADVAVTVAQVLSA